MRTVLVPLLVALVVNTGVLFLLPLIGETVSRFVRSGTPPSLVVEPYERRTVEAPEEVSKEEVAQQMKREDKSEEDKSEEEVVEKETVLLEKVVQVDTEAEQSATELRLGAAIEPHLRGLEGTPVAEGSPKGVPEGSAPSEKKGKRGIFEPPVLIESVRPDYPQWACEQGIEGIVTVRMLVNEEGRVEKVETVRTSGYKVLDEAAIAAVRLYKFIPSKKDGIPLKVWVGQEIIFKIER
ncbi:MAG: TonB family protein [Planctomycetota bacterium]|nr:TonB family protein [Planctomycetota bacterium]